MLDWIFEGIVTWVSSMVTKLLDAVSGVFLNALGTNMTAMEEYFPFVTKAFTILQYTSWAVLFLITVWQLFRVFGGPITEAENPWTLIARSALFAVLINYAKQIFDIALNIATAPYTALMEVTMNKEDFTFAGIEEIFKSGLITILAGASVVGLLLLIILMITLGWNYFKLLLETVERYVVVGVLCYTSPLAFSMGASKSTSQVFHSWCRMVGSQLLMLVMNVWFLRAFNSSVGQFVGNGGALTTGKGNIFLWFFCVIAFLKTAQKFDSYLAAMGLNVAQTGAGMGLELLMAARAVTGLGHAGKSAGTVFSGAAVAAAGTNPASGFASRFKPNSYVRDAVTDGGARMGAGGGMGFVGRAFGGIAARNGAVLTVDSIASVAGRNAKVSGEIAGDIADRSLQNYMPQLNGMPLKNTKIKGGKISTTAMTPEGQMAELNMYKADQFEKPEGASQTVTASDGSMWYQTVSGDGAGAFFGIPEGSDGNGISTLFPDMAKDTAFRSVDEGVIEATTDSGNSLWYSSAFYDEPEAPHSNIQASDGVDCYAMAQQARMPAFETGDGAEAYNIAQFQSFMPGYDAQISAVDAEHCGNGQIEIRNLDGSAVRFYDAARYQAPGGEYENYEDSNGGSWYAVKGEATVVKTPVYEDGRPVYSGENVSSKT
ncbi:MAG: hypothetical protein IJ801_01200, partial [Lachnospiraceae bacterium]|nr:hypothetical protein [Lachnospiraceae bacterium]